MRHTPSGAMRDESGAVAAVVAIVLTVLLIVSAFIIDLGALRADRIAGKSAADMAAISAVFDYEQSVPGSAEAACFDALDYVVRNHRGITSTPTAEPDAACDDEDVFGDDYVCDPNDLERTAVYTTGSFRIEITLPVHDGDLMAGQQVSEEFDGSPCQRLGVRVERERQYLLGGVTDSFSGTTRPSSVAVKTIGGEDEFVSLIVLKRQGCRVLENDGGATIRVFDFEDEDGQVFPGRITIDTRPQGCGGAGQKVIDSSGGDGIIEATGDIFSFGLMTTDQGNNHIYRPGHVPDNLTPEPQPGDIITRQAIDHRYNCQTTSGEDGPGPGYSAATASTPYDPDASHLPDAHSTKVEPCPGADTYEDLYKKPRPSVSYIAELHSELQDMTAAEADADDDWSVFPHDAGTDDDCDGGTITGSADVDRWFIDCPGTFNPESFTATNVDFLVFPSSIHQGGGDLFSINAANGYYPGTIVYVQDGEFTRGGGQQSMRDTFVYLNSRSDGRIGMTGQGDGQFSLKAPLNDDVDEVTHEPIDHCDLPGGIPNASCFAPLALWSNFTGTTGGTPNLNTLQGNAAGGVIGSVFTPNGKFRFRGEGSDSEAPCSAVTWSEIDTGSGSLNLEGSQFFAEMFDTAGGASVRLCPSPSSTVPNPVTGTRLVR